jgi:hypothetical protein
MKINICVIAGDKQTNKMMGMFDMNDNGMKAFALPTNYSATADESFDDAKAKKVVDGFKLAHEKAGQVVVAVIVDGFAKVAYIDKSIKMISNGSKFLFFQDLLDAYGINLEDATPQI